MTPQIITQTTSCRLKDFINHHAGKAVHVVGTVDDPTNQRQIISIEVTPFKSGKYSHFHVRLYRKNDPYGDPVKREDVALSNEGHMCWRNELEYMKTGSWVEMISEITKVYVKEDNQWVTKEWDSPECAICFRNWGVNTSLPCRHLFCNSCIMKWAQVNNTCPCCRQEFVVKFNPKPIVVEEQ